MATYKFQSDQITECRFWLWCTVIVLLITFFFGLRFKGYSIENDARLLPHNGGLDFHGNGIAYTGGLGDAVKIFDKKFSIETSLLLRDPNSRKFRIILIFHGGDDRKQLIIGQWQNWLIIMNGDDYDHSRKMKRISVKIAKNGDDKDVFLTIVSTREKTSLFLDGKLVRQLRGFHLEMPQVPDTRLIIGNGVYGKRAWNGAIRGLSFYGRALSCKEIAGHFIHWRLDHDFGFVRKHEPAILYLFKGLQHRMVRDYGTLGKDLEIPYVLHGLKPNFFSLRPEIFINETISSVDCLINLVGFIPLGFTLFALLKTKGMSFERAAMTALSCCFLVSLCIEIIQAWIPSRSSDSIDIFFNILGALLGIVLWKGIAIIIHRFPYQLV